MRRTLAALALALALPGPALLAPPARAQAVVVVREGDTLSDIAERHGVGLTRLMQANGISDPDLVVVGQRLTIPGGGNRGGGGPAGGGGGSVTVQAGDTLSDIAARYGISVSRLMQANGISDPDLVVAGQRLIIPGRGGRSAAPATRSTQPTAPYTVKSGETLSDIATRFNTSTDRLIQLNGLRNPDLVMSGTRLQVPVSPRPQTSRPAGASTPAASPDRNARQHVVQSGESLSVIAERYGTTVERLVALNRIEDPDQLLSGTRLQLRGTPPAAAPRPAASPQAPKPQASTQPAPRQVAQPAPRSAPEPTPQTQLQPQAQAQAQPKPQPQPQVRTQAQTQAQSQSRTDTTPAARSQPAAATPTRQSAPTPSRAEPAPANTTTTSPVRAGATAGTTATTAPAPNTATTTTTATAANTATTATTASPSNTASRATAAKATVAAPATSAGSTAAAPAARPEARTRPQAQAPVQPAAVQTASVRTPAGSTSRIAAATGGVTPTQPGVAPSAMSSAVALRESTPAKSSAQPPAGSAPMAARSTTRAPSSGGDWRSYGPLQIDWSNWQSMGGSYVAPSLNSDGKARYLAVNCAARKLNTTTPAGQWNSWEAPGQDYEKKLVQDICKEKGS